MHVKTIMLSVIFLMLINTASAIPVTNGLITEYDFIEGSDHTILYDISGYGHNGTITGGTWTSYGLSFNGTSDYVNLGDLGNLSAGYTVIVVTKSNTETSQCVFSRVSTTNAATGDGMLIKRSNTNNEWDAYNYHNIASTYYGRSRVIGDGMGWNMITARYNNTSKVAQVFNGQHIRNLDYGDITLPGGLVDHTGNYTVGKLSYTGSWYLNGSVAYLTVYNRTLSDTELSSVQSYIMEEMDNRSLPITHPLDKQYIALTLDDGRYTDYENGLRIARQKDIPLTSFIAASKVGTTGYMSWNQIKELRANGWDVEDHTYNHIELTTLSTAQIAQEFENSNSAFTAVGLPTPKHMSYPLGSWNTTVQGVVDDYRLSGRAISGITARNINGYESFNSSAYKLRAYPVYSQSTNMTDIYAQIDSAIAGNYALILYSHDISSSPDVNGISITDYTNLINYIAAKRDAGLITPITIDGLYNEINNIEVESTVNTTSQLNPYFGSGITCTVDSNGFPYHYSRMLTNDDMKAHITVVPTSGDVTINVTEWSTDNKTWVLSSEVEQDVTHTVTGLTPNKNLSIYRDGVLYANVTSNSSGGLNWVYDGGFSEHTFSLVYTPETRPVTPEETQNSQSVRSEANELWTNGVSLISILAMVIMVCLTIVALKQGVNFNTLVNASIALMIITITVELGYGLLTCLGEVI